MRCCHQGPPMSTPAKFLKRQELERNLLFILLISALMPPDVPVMPLSPFQPLVILKRMIHHNKSRVKLRKNWFLKTSR